MNERTAHQAMDEAADWAIKHRAQTHRVIDFPVRHRPQTSWLAYIHSDRVTISKPPLKWLSSRVNWWPILGALSVVASWVLAALIYIVAQYIAGVFQ